MYGKIKLYVWVSSVGFIVVAISDRDKMFKL